MCYPLSLPLTPSLDLLASTCHPCLFCGGFFHLFNSFLNFQDCFCTSRTQVESLRPEKQSETSIHQNLVRKDCVQLILFLCVCNTTHPGSPTSISITVSLLFSSDLSLASSFLSKPSLLEHSPIYSKALLLSFHIILKLPQVFLRSGGDSGIKQN